MVSEHKVLLLFCICGTLLCTHVACKTTQPAQHPTLEKTIQNTFTGDSTIREYNSSHEYVLVKGVQTASNEGLPVKFIVIRIKDGKLLMADDYQRGYIRWTGVTMLEELSMPGKIQPETDVSRFKTTHRIITEP